MHGTTAVTHHQVHHQGYVEHRLMPALDLAYLQQLMVFCMHLLQQLEAPARAASTAQGFAEVVAAISTASAAAKAAPTPPSTRVTCALTVGKGGAVAAQLAPAPAWGAAGALATAVADALRFVGDKVDEVTMDMVRVRLEMLQSLLHTGGNGIEYARRRYQRAIDAAGSIPVALPVTTQWLTSHPGAQASPKGALSAALVALVQHPQPMLGLDGAVSAACPETLVLDAGRITTLQNELQRLSLTAAIMLTAANALHTVLEGAQRPPAGGPRIATQGLGSRVRSRFLVLLSQPDVGREGLQQELTNLVVEHAQQTTPDLDLTAARCLASTTCAAMLDAVLRPDSAIYARVQAGLCTALAAGLAASSPAATIAVPSRQDVRNATAGVQESERARVQGLLAAALAPVGAAALAPEVGDWVAQAGLVLELTWAVSGPWYEALWHARAALAAEA